MQYADGETARGARALAGGGCGGEEQELAVLREMMLRARQEGEEPQVPDEQLRSNDQLQHDEVLLATFSAPRHHLESYFQGWVPGWYHLFFLIKWMGGHV